MVRIKTDPLHNGSAGGNTLLIKKDTGNRMASINIAERNAMNTKYPLITCMLSKKTSQYTQPLNLSVYNDIATVS